MTGPHGHHCQRSDDLAAEFRNLCLFGHLSGANRARMGYPVSRRIQALRLQGREVAAQILTDETARQLMVGPIVSIPAQRTPHPSEQRLADVIRRKNRGDR